MAKTQFHENQHVNVKSVSTWALIERAVPHWTKDIDEPIRIHYDKPAKIGKQARLIACAPQLAGFAGALADWARESGEDMPDELAELAHRAQHLLSDVKRTSW